MIQIMSRQAAAERGLLPPTFKERLHPMPSNIWRPTLTDKQKEEQEKAVASGLMPF